MAVSPRDLLESIIQQANQLRKLSDERLALVWDEIMESESSLDDALSLDEAAL